MQNLSIMKYFNNYSRALRTVNLTSPSSKNLRKFHASVCLIVDISTPATVTSSSPTFRTPHLAADPPLNILLILTGTSPLGDPMPPSMRKPSPVTPLTMVSSNRPSAFGSAVSGIGSIGSGITKNIQNIYYSITTI